VTDGRDHPLYKDSPGFFLAPSLMDDVTPDMDAYKDEIFGPVLSMTRVETYDQAVDLVNRNPYGNGVALFTRDGGAARQFTFEVEAGMVGINVPIPVPVAYYSFGGWKSSLFGDAHMYGPEGIRFYTRGKVVTQRWGEVRRRWPELRFRAPTEMAQAVRSRIPRWPGPPRRTPRAPARAEDRGAEALDRRAGGVHEPDWLVCALTALVVPLAVLLWFAR
jgi:hypothetical protein